MDFVYSRFRGWRDHVAVPVRVPGSGGCLSRAVDKGVRRLKETHARNVTYLKTRSEAPGILRFLMDELREQYHVRGIAFALRLPDMPGAFICGHNILEQDGGDPVSRSWSPPGLLTGPAE